MATQTRARSAVTETPTPAPEPSIGELVKGIASDLSTLMHQELELAKVEIKDEARKAGQSAGMLGAAGFAGYMVLLFLTLAGVFGLADAIGLGWAALVAAVVWATIGAVLFLTGRERLRRVRTPEKTVETLKEDARWARHPIS
jgi:uncharacterized membrane protein YqjE